MIVLTQQIAKDIAAAASPLIIVFVLGLIVGSIAPTYYAGEQLRGFGRAMLEKLPYKPPPGKEEEEALIEATDESVDDASQETEENSE